MRDRKGSLEWLFRKRLAMPGAFALQSARVSAFFRATPLALGALILNACERRRDDGWATYNKTYAGDRFSLLAEITPANVARLKPVCRLPVGEEGTFQAGPVVVDGRMFVTTAHTTLALDAATCAVHWRFVDTVRQHDVYPVNRGVAYLDGLLFRGTPDGRLMALNARTGKLKWAVAAGDPGQGEFLSSAPIAWHGTVFTGLAGSDWGIRGRVMGFDAATGKELWRFFTVPLAPEQGAETWRIPETARHGGGGTWTSYALDTLSGDLFVPVANPSPDFAPLTRPGDNLFTNALVVLDAASGKLKWWYQLTPHDGFDWDLGAAPVLYSTAEHARRVALASKDGHAYAIDRGTHSLVFKTPVTTITNAGSAPNAKGTYVCPGALGGVEWNGPAFDPQTNSLYVGAVDWCQVISSGHDLKWVPGQLFLGTMMTSSGADSVATGWLTALDATSGAVRWRFHAPAPIVAGVTPTAGGLVFAGDLDGTLYAFDAASGRVLHSFNTGAAIAGGIVTYAVHGKQYVATTSGNISRATFHTSGSPTLIVMTLAAP